MGKPVNPRDRAIFMDRLRQGFTIAEAAREINRSYAWGKSFVHKMYANGTLRPQDIKRAQALATDPELYPASELGIRALDSPIPLDDLDSIPRDCLDDFGRYRARYMGRKSSPWQEDAAYKLVRLLQTPRKEFIVVNCPPGGGKSTLFTHDLPSWVTTKSRSIRGFIGSDTQPQATEYNGRLRNTFERQIPQEAQSEEIALGLAFDAEEVLAHDYGPFKPLIPDLWQRRQFTVTQFGQTSTGQKEATWTAWGWDSGFVGWRVNFIIWDDLVSLDEVGNLDLLEKQRRKWTSVAERRLEPGGILILQGQRLHAEDLYRWCRERAAGKEIPGLTTPELVEVPNDIHEVELRPPKGKKYHHIVYKAHYEDKCKGETLTLDSGEVVLNPEHSPLAEPHHPDGTGGCLLDPLRLSYDELKAEMDEPFSNYRVVFQQEDVDPSDALIPEPWIRGGSDGTENFMGCLDSDRDIAQLPANLTGLQTSMVTIDPSPARYWSLQWWLYAARDNNSQLTGMRYLLDLERKPMSADTFLDWNVESGTYTGILQEWWDRAQKLGIPLHYVVVEANAAQKFMLQYDFMRRWFIEHSCHLLPHETTRNKNDPEYGLKVLRSHYRFGRYRLPYYSAEARRKTEYLVHELTRYPNASTTDCLMANWFFEYQLQHLTAAEADIPSLYSDLPGWLVDRQKEPDAWDRMFSQFTTTGYNLLESDLDEPTPVEGIFDGISA